VLIVDDVLATGGTAEAALRLVESLGVEVAGFSFLIGLSFLPGGERLAATGTAHRSLIEY
jgi:adenine phosphoribosyltransferase